MENDIFKDFHIAYARQSELFYGQKIDLLDFKKVTKQACDKYYECLSKKKLKHSPTSIIKHADEYTTFLVFLSRLAYISDYVELAESAYLINKRMNSFDCFYTREMPDIFYLVHPIGSIVGQAKMKNYLVIYQGVSIGGDLKYQYPTLGEGVILFSNSSILSNTIIGNNCVVGAGVQLYSDKIKDNTAISYRHNQNQLKKSISWSIKDRYFPL